VRSRLRTGVAVGALVVACVTSAAVALVHRSHAVGPYELVPANLTALASPGTAVRDVPTQAARFSASLGAEPPARGSVHRVGGGRASAWVSGGHVCWLTTWRMKKGSSLAECITQTHRNTPIEPMVTQRGRRTVVEGMAVDSVRSVWAKVKDGRIFSTKPLSNFYWIELPAGADPWDLVEAGATLSNGKNYPTAISIQRPPTHTRFHANTR